MTVPVGKKIETGEPTGADTVLERTDVDFRIVTAGDSMMVAEFEAVIDPAINARVVALAASIASAKIQGVRDVVPTYRSVAVYFDPLKADLENLVTEVTRLARSVRKPRWRDQPPILVPVCYGGKYGPDLEEVARFAGCPTEEVIRLHTAATYRVYMLGFLPGRAYMASVDSRIAMPRHHTPRLRVPGGSVGIAGLQTGFSAAEHPNGWRIIGRTAVKQFDLSRKDPLLFNSGDSVKFRAISERELLESAPGLAEE